ncbi:hypothetical protein [Pedobacter agri]|uniref:hypothetical protein n=1 Tax=Pedobacter agri TaxID=454586 RepID=UPI00292F504A|nr:hypothetical protein [Pedobacter agri]
MNIRLTPLLSMLCFAAMVSCKKNETFRDTLPPPLIATQKKYNPYSVNNMRKAVASMLAGDIKLSRNNKLSYVKGKMILSTKEGLGINKQMTLDESLKIAEQGIAATHYYIKFIPRNQADMDKLKIDSNLTIYPFPLDNQQTKYNGSYRDPSVLPNVPTYQYAAVPVAYRLPDVPYQKLEDLYIPNEKQHGNLIMLKADGNSSYSVDGQELANFSECGGGEVGGGGEGEPIDEEVLDEPNECGGGGGSYPPNDEFRNGENWRPHGRITVHDDLKGIIGVEGIRVRARRWFTTYDGFTDANGYYAVDGWFTRPANYWLNFERYDFEIMDGENPLNGNREISGPKIEAAWDVQFTGYDKFCSTVFRAAYHYYHKNIDGLHRPPMNSFWAAKVHILPLNDNSTNTGGIMYPISWHLGESIKIHGMLAPIDQSYSTTIHELTHAAHWDNSNLSFLLSARTVAESWATGVEWYLTKMEYPDYKGFNVPNNDNYRNVVMDLIDSPGSLNYGFSAPKDEVEGYNIVDIQNTCINSPTTWGEWKDNIINNYNNGTEQHVETLFNYWLNY